jgi:hypothetical protein
MFAALQNCFSSSDGRTTITAWHFTGKEACRVYFRERVAPRLSASDGRTLLEQHLREAADTGFDLSQLEEQAVHPPPPRDWEIGEAIAEVVLEDQHGGRFPWPTALDKRSPTASLPGPDLVGFHLQVDRHRFLFGEVKSSSEKKSPPSVVTQNQDGLIQQLRRLLTSQEHQLQPIQWLLVRTKDTEWRQTFDSAFRRYFSEQPDAWIVGVLVRGAVDPSPADVEQACDVLDSVDAPFDVALIAVYLPFARSEWSTILTQDGGMQ